MKPLRSPIRSRVTNLITTLRTHGTYRPFLLPQIRKNDPTDIHLATQKAQVIVSDTTASDTQVDIPCLRKALDTVCNAIKGVGPATGTLILSAFHGKEIPFFEDELYWWVHPEEAIKGAKLKYNVKEYFNLFEKVVELRRRLGGDDDDEGDGKDMPPCSEVEKVAFVIGHWDCWPGTGTQGDVDSAMTKTETKVETLNGKNEDDGAARGAGRKRKASESQVETPMKTNSRSKVKKQESDAEDIPTTKRSQWQPTRKTRSSTQPSNE